MSVGYQNGGKQRDDGSRTRENAQSAGADWDTLKDDVSDMAGAAVERGRGFIDSARDQAADYADRRKDDAAQSVTDLAQSLREACKTFDERPNIQAFVDAAATGLDQLAGSIRDRSAIEMFNEAEAFLRRRPAALAAASLVAGFAVARFIKASAENLRDHDMQQRASERQRARARGRG